MRDPARAVKLHRDENAQISVHSNPASVEDLVMKRAEHKAIGHDVWLAILFPADVGSLERNILSAEPKIKTADCTAMLVGSDHVAAKPWVTSPSGAAGGVGATGSCFGTGVSEGGWAVWSAPYLVDDRVPRTVQEQAEVLFVRWATCVAEVGRLARKRQS